MKVKTHLSTTLAALSLVVLRSGEVTAFSPDFTQWLLQRYGGNNTDRFFTRISDLGEDLSFGGRTEPQEKLKNQPVLFIHGLGQTAANMALLVPHYIARGYKSSELYGSTWPDQGGDILNTPAKCLYIRRVRLLLHALARYTGSKVDVVAYSMGVPVARKAILGGTCVDTGKRLGASLGDLVDTFLGVAGSNLGKFILHFR